MEISKKKINHYTNTDTLTFDENYYFNYITSTLASNFNHEQIKYIIYIYIKQILRQEIQCNEKSSQPSSILRAEKIYLFIEEYTSVT
jgi:hypothetical protein